MKKALSIFGLALLLAACGNDVNSGGGAAGGDSGANKGGGGGGTPVSNDLMPLKAGYEWTYDIKTNMPTAPCQPGEFVMKIPPRVGKHTDGKTLYPVLGNMCTMAGGFHNADGKLLQIANGWVTYLDSKMEVDHEWELLGGKVKWVEEIKDLELRGAKYKNCWVREHDFGANQLVQQTFCKGVGLVKVVGPDTDDGKPMWIAELTKKNF